MRFPWGIRCRVHATPASVLPNVPCGQKYTRTAMFVLPAYTARSSKRVRCWRAQRIPLAPEIRLTRAPSLTSLPSLVCRVATAPNRNTKPESEPNRTEPNRWFVVARPHRTRTLNRNRNRTEQNKTVPRRSGFLNEPRVIGKHVRGQPAASEPEACPPVLGLHDRNFFSWGSFGKRQHNASATTLLVRRQ